MQGFYGFLGPIFVDLDCAMSQRDLAQPYLNKRIQKDADEEAHGFIAFLFVCLEEFLTVQFFKGP